MNVTEERLPQLILNYGTRLRLIFETEYARTISGCNGQDLVNHLDRFKELVDHPMQLLDVLPHRCRDLRPIITTHGRSVRWRRPRRTHLQ